MQKQKYQKQTVQEYTFVNIVRITRVETKPAKLSHHLKMQPNTAIEELDSKSAVS
jgi:hypothetical protein